MALMKRRTMWTLYGMLLFCVGESVAQDVLTPQIDIIAEIEKLNNLDTKVKELEETLSKVLQAPKVAFSAGLLASGAGPTGPTSELRLVYKKVFTNTGSGYDSDTGIFTAPVKGVYFFHFYGHCHGGNTMGVTLRKNGETQCSVYSHKSPVNGNGSNGVTLTLEKGDEVYTILWGSTWVYDDPASYTSFSGFLIFPL